MENENIDEIKSLLEKTKKITDKIKDYLKKTFTKKFLYQLEIFMKCAEEYCEGLPVLK